MRSRLVLLFALSAAAVIAQTSSPFEVASVKPNKSGTTQANIGMLPNGVNFVNLPLRAIIQFAYGINQPSKLAGVPDWAVSERYDINARAAGPVTLEERRSMLQALLADRFKLVARLENGKLGKNLVESTECVAPGSAAAKEVAAGNAPAGAPTSICGPKPGGAGRLVLTGIPMQQFTSLLGLMVAGTVVDKTGLTGRYDIDLTYTPEQPIPAGVNIPGPPADPNGPSLYTALREQLGLKLESQKNQEDVLVIDRVERQPSEN